MLVFKRLFRCSRNPDLWGAAGGTKCNLLLNRVPAAIAIALHINKLQETGKSGQGTAFERAFQARKDSKEGKTGSGENFIFHCEAKLLWPRRGGAANPKKSQKHISNGTFRNSTGD